MSVTTKRLGLAILLACFSQGAYASAIYTYSLDNPTAAPAGNPNGGHVSNITTTFNTNTNDFSWMYTVESKNDGFWLVVSDGENPKGNAQEYAILYGDLDTNKLWAYEYNGQNKSDSYQENKPGNLLQYWGSSVFDTVDAGNGYKTVSFSLNATAINNADPQNNSPSWDGIYFDDLIGLWFHPSAGTQTAQGANNKLTNFSYNQQGWADLAYQQTTEVPEPGTLSLFLAALIAMFTLRNVSLTRVMRKVAVGGPMTGGFAAGATA